MRKYFDKKQKQILKTVGAVALIAGLSAAPAYAGTWIQPEDQTWMYEEEESYATGWRQIDGAWYYFDEAGIMQTGWVRAADDGLWYYLDQTTGAWIVRPAMTADVAEKLLENAVEKTGFYKDETNPLYIYIDKDENGRIFAELRLQTGPAVFSTMNSYEISKKTGIADAVAGPDLNLYEY